MTVLVEPYVYVRTITIGLGTLWTLGGLYRVLRFTRRWHARLVPLGLPESWLRRKMVVAVLRATLLDPINLALILVLLSLWSARWTV